MGSLPPGRLAQVRGLRNRARKCLQPIRIPSGPEPGCAVSPRGAARARSAPQRRLLHRQDRGAEIRNAQTTTVLPPPAGWSPPRLWHLAGRFELGVRLLLRSSDLYGRSSACSSRRGQYTRAPWSYFHCGRWNENRQIGPLRCPFRRGSATSNTAVRRAPPQEFGVICRLRCGPMRGIRPRETSRYALS